MKYQRSAKVQKKNYRVWITNLVKLYYQLVKLNNY